MIVLFASGPRQLVFQHLAGGIMRQRVEEAHLLRHLLAREL